MATPQGIRSVVVRRRPIKVRGGTLGWFLCWAVVFADIGTSIYYTPGILAPQFGTRSAIFVCLTLIVFILLSAKYAEVAWRYPEGGGVVNVASRALHPFAGLVGGVFILIDYYLTAAISALSGMFYLAVVAPGLAPAAVALTVAALLGLGVLNFMGVRDSARVSATVAVLAALGQLTVVAAAAVSLGPAGIADTIRAVLRGPALTPLSIITGYAAAFLAFSGLETIAQLAPSMREPRSQIARRAMFAVVITMVVTSPLLTLWSTTLLGPGADPNQYISLLGARVSGRLVGAYVAVSGSLLLVFASNTAIIGAYHVFVALTRMGFLPRVLDSRNRWRRTPHWAILLAVGLPIALVVVTRGNVGLLGDLYAFGLLGAFILTSLSLDVVRANEHWWSTRPVAYVLGLLTTALVAIAWLTNLVAKPLATEFGGTILIIGVAAGLLTYNWLRGRQPVVFPLLHRGHLPVVAAGPGHNHLPRCPVMAIIPHDPELAEAVVRTAIADAGAVTVAFVYHGEPIQQDPGRLMEVVDPYLRDRRAQVAFSRAESAARRKVRRREYIYVPGSLRREALADVWKSVHPREMVLVDGDQDFAPSVAVDRVRRLNVDGVPVLRLVTAAPRATVSLGS